MIEYRKKYSIISQYMNKMLVITFFSLFLAGCGNSDSLITISEKTPTTAEGTLAKCLAEKGAIIYGTQWCPHCKDQKKAFGSESKEFLPFVDCDKKKGACSKAGIEGYPTWKFSDNSELVGTQSLEALAKKTNCEYTK